MNLPSCKFWPQIWGSSWPVAELHGIFVFLSQLMATCRRRAPRNYSFLMTQTWITCCWRLVGQNTCNFAEIMHWHSSNRHSEYVTTCMRSWCSLPMLGWRGGGGGGRRDSNSANKYVQKYVDTDWIMIALHKVNAKITESKGSWLSWRLFNRRLSYSGVTQGWACMPLSAG